ncbi:hypothetical protein LSAT2_008203 [Lamellibrachia satsuma]|nr:hypothetical protein LSAT2_008203 [Lamellibrachia satsuma]
MTLDLCQPYYFIDEECMSRYNCTLKPRLPCHVKVLSECPPPTHLVHWPTKPTDVTVTEYDSVFGLRKRQCYGRENITWGIPNDGSMERLKGFTLTITCLHGHCFGRKECVYFNLSKAVWDIGDIVSKVTYSFDCLRPLRGTHHIDLATLPKAHDGSNSYATTVTLPLKDCRPPSTAAPTTPSTPRPTSSTGSITTSGTGDTSTARQRPTTTSDSLTTTSDISTKTSFVSATTYVVASTPLTSGERTPTPAESKEETRSRQNPGVFTAVTIALGCFCGFLLSTLLLFFIYKRYRMTGIASGNILDLILTSNPSIIINTHTTPGMSDHESVTFNVNLNPVRNKKPPHQVYSYKSADWDQLKDDIDKLNLEYFDIDPNSQDIDINWTFFPRTPDYLD